MADPGLILGATALGGAISFVTTYGMARRAEKAAARSTARVLRDDLNQAREMLAVALKGDAWWPADFSLPTRSWHEDRTPLALFIDDAAWRTLSDAFVDLALTNAVAEDLVSPTGRKRIGSDQERVRLQQTLASVSEALVVLSDFSRSRSVQRIRRLARRVNSRRPSGGPR